MLTNYITDTDLKKYHPNLSKQLWLNTSSYSTQINEAFERVLTDIVNKGFNPRKIMLPYDLKRETGTLNNAFPHSSIETTSTTGSSFELDVLLKRFVVNVTTITGGWTIKLQGSNDNSSWEDITNATLTFANSGSQNVIYEGQYKYWRYISIENSAGSITYTVYLEDTSFDKLIIYKIFQMIFTDFRKAQNDVWDLLVIDYEKQYDVLMNSLKFMYDEDDSGTIDSTETAQSETIFLM